LSPGHLHSPLSISSSLNDVPLIETRIEDGKLLYEKRWFHRGQSVFVEGRDLPKFPANISAIGNDMVSPENMIEIILTDLVVTVRPIFS
jgi:Sin3 histone deacetylase corepressor complex component SDS3